MKKLIVVLTILAVLACSMMTVSAASKDQLIAAIKEIPVVRDNEGLYNSIVAEIKKIDLSSDEIDKLLVIADKANDIVPTGSGLTADSYTTEQKKEILKLMDQASAITGYSYKIESNGNGSVEMQVFNEDGKVAMVYDGEKLVAKTGSEFNPAYLCVAGATLALASAAAVIIFRKKSEANG